MAPAGTPGWLLGVDFGTSNTAAAHIDESTGTIAALPLTYNSNLMSSSVFIAAPDRIEVGDVALNQAASNPSGFVGAPKRQLTLGQMTFRAGPWEVPAHLVVAAVLRAVIARGQERHAGRPPSGLVLTHPEGWSSQQIRVLTDAANQVGYPTHLVRTVSEPQAAAQYYTRNRTVAPNGRIAVFDFGGGTLDVAVLTAAGDGTFRVTAARGDNALGGRNFDAAIRRWIEAQLAQRDPEMLRLLDADAASLVDQRGLEDSIRRTKELLSETPSAMLDVRSGDRFERLSLTRPEFEELIGRDVARAVELTRGTLALAGVTEPTDLQAIYLTGGSSRIPLVHRQLQALGSVATLDDPKTVVAQGALADAARVRPATAPPVFAPAPVAAPLPPPVYQAVPPNYAPSMPMPRPMPAAMANPMPAPLARSGGGNGRAVAFGLGALVLVGGVIAAAIALTSSGSTPTPTAARTTTTTTAAAPVRYRLTSPDTVAGDYQKDKVSAHNESLTPNANDTAEYAPFGFQLSGALTATYHQGVPTIGNANATGRGMVFFGLWGAIANPQRAVDAAPTTVEKDMLTNNGLASVGTLEPQSPGGLDDDAVVECQFLRDNDSHVEVPLCVWADHSTMGVVSIVNQNLTLSAAATVTAEIRDQSRTPAS